MASTLHFVRLSSAVMALLMTALCACSAPASMPHSDTAPVIAALIVKPRVTTSDPAAVLKPMRATLGEAAGTRYVRALAGDAHLVHLTGPAQPGEVAQLIERLRSSAAFQYVELDSMIKIK